MNNIKELVENIRSQRSYKININIHFNESHLVLNAMEKQLPMKTEIFVSNDDIKIGRFTFKAGCTIHRCPVCKTNTAYGKYCVECGQRIERCEP